MKIKTRFITLLSLVLSLFSFSAFSQPQPSPIELIQLQEDLYLIYNPVVPGNVTVLVTDEGVIMVDDKFAWDYDNIMNMIASITDQPVKYVINTHFHGDHSGGNEQAQADGAIVVASENARIKFIENNQPGAPDFTLDEHAFIHLGGEVVEIFRFGRAHTDGDIVVYFPERRVLATGDMFTYGADVPQLIDYSGGGSARAWSRTLDEVLRLDFDTVVPGHGPVTNKTEMANFREDTIRIRVRTRELLSNGASKAEVEAMLRSEFGWADLHVNRGLDGLIAEVQ